MAVRYTAFVRRPLSYAVALWGGNMSNPLVGSQAVAQLTLEDAGGRVLDAAVTLQVKLPAVLAGGETFPPSAVPHLGEGVYALRLPTSAFPTAGQDYQALWHVTTPAPTAYDQQMTTYHTAVLS